MRNSCKKSFTILSKDKKTGEFTSVKRFNHKDYRMSSIFDNETSDTYPDIFYKLSSMNESWLDDLDLDIIDMGDDSEEEDEEQYIEVKSTEGNDIEVVLSDDKISNAFVCAVVHMLVLDRAFFGNYTRVDDLVHSHGSNRSKKLFVDKLDYSGGSLKFVISGRARLGILELNYKDDTCEEISISFVPSSDLKYGYSASYFSLDYQDFRNVSKYSGYFRKKPQQYYRQLLPALVETFNSHGITITLAECRGLVEVRDFMNVQDSSFLSKFKAISKYDGENKNFEPLVEASIEDLERVKDIYSTDTKFTGSDFNKDNKWIIVARGDRFVKSFYESGLCKTVPDSEGNPLSSGNFVRMQWVAVKGTKKVNVTAMAMPLKCFMLYAPLFYMFFSNHLIS